MDRLVEVPVEKVVEVPVPYEVVKEVPVERVVTKQVQDDDTINRLQVLRPLSPKHREGGRGGVVQRDGPWYGSVTRTVCVDVSLWSCRRKSRGSKGTWIVCRKPRMILSLKKIK